MPPAFADGKVFASQKRGSPTEFIWAKTIIYAMTSIVTAYYNRKKLFLRTLENLAWLGGEDFEVVAVDDGSDEAERIEDLVERFKFLRVIRLDPRRKWYSNPCVPFNLAIKEALGDLIILQNPECLHAGDVLGHAKDNLRNGVYLSYACYALSEIDTAAFGSAAAPEVQAIATGFPLRDHPPQCVGGEGWYNHSRINPRGYHFCAALTKHDLLRLGGFDERYAHGIAYDDDDLVHRIKQAGIRFDFIDKVMVYHQHHYVNPGNGIPCAKVRRNETVFKYITQPSLSYSPNGASWGEPYNPAVRIANEAMDSLMQGSVDYQECLSLTSEWRAYAMRLETLLAESGVVAGGLRSSIESVVLLASSISRGPCGRFVWGSSQQRQLRKISRWMEKARGYEQKGRVECSISEYSKALSESSTLLNGLSKGWQRRIAISQSWLRSTKALITGMEQAYADFLRRKSDALKMRPPDEKEERRASDCSPA